MSTQPRRKIIKERGVRFDAAPIEERALDPRRVLRLDERNIQWVSPDDPDAASVASRVLHPGEAEDRIKPYVEPDLNAFADGVPRPAASPVEAPAAPSPGEEDASDSDEDEASQAWIDALRAEWEQDAEASWTIRLDEAVRTAREEAYSLGCSDTREALQHEIDEARSRIDLEVTHFRDTWAHFIRKAEPALVEMTFEVAEALLDGPLPDAMRTISERALLEALDEFAGEAPLEIGVHSVDLLRLKESGLVQRIEELHPGVCWEPKPSIREGDWVAQSPKKAIRRITEELILNLKDRFGTKEDDPAPNPPAPAGAVRTTTTRPAPARRTARPSAPEPEAPPPPGAGATDSSEPDDAPSAGP